MHRSKPIAVAAVALLVLAALAPAATAADGSFDVGVHQVSDGGVHVEVTHDGSDVGGANVTVETGDANETYAGTGEYTTDQNGSVFLPAPEDTVVLTVTATDGNLTDSTTTDVLAPGLDVDVSQAADASVTVSVENRISTDPTENASVTVEATDDESYVGEGSYTTDANGTVGLPAPTSNVTVHVEAAAGDLRGDVTHELVVENATGSDDADAFGQQVSNYVHWLLSEDPQGGIGPMVAEFVLANNPGNAPDHAGPPDHVTGNASNAGPPEHAGPAGNETAPSAGGPEGAGNGDNGPPDHAGPAADDDDDERGPENGPDEARGPPN